MNFLVRVFSFIKAKSHIRFIAFVLLLFGLRALEFSVDYWKGDGDGSMTSPIGLALNTIYLVLIAFSSYNFSSVSKFFNKKSTIIVLIGISAILSIGTLRNGHGWGDDFSLYIAQAKVICEGGFNQLKAEQTFIQTNSGYMLGPDFYPWGFPVLLAPAYKVFGFNLMAFKVVTFLWFPLLLWLLYFSFKNELEDKTGLFIGLFALSPVIFDFRDTIGSDIPFMFFSMLGILMIRRIIAKDYFFSNEAFSYLFLGFLIFVVYSIKAAGIVLLPVLMFTQIYEGMVKKEERKIPLIKTLLPYLTFGVLLILYSVISGYSDSSYANQLDLANIYYHLQFNFFYYLNIPAEFFDAPVLNNFSTLFWGICFVFVVFGIVDIKSRDIPLLFYVVFMIGILLIAPYQAGVRYIFPILPVLIYFLICGICSFEKRVFLQNISGILLFPVLVFFMYGILLQSTEALLHRDKVWEGPFDKEGKEIMDFVSNNTTPDDVIIFYKPRALRLLTGRKSFVVRKISEIRDGRANYIIIHRNAINDLFPPNEEISALFENKPAFENNDFFVYRIGLD